MQIIISCAKNMTLGEFNRDYPVSQPRFLEQALAHAEQMKMYSVEELMSIFKCSEEIAVLNRTRYQNFSAQLHLCQAALSYSGVAYQHLKADSFSLLQADYANRHLWITSFLYGLLRPMDLIHNYRMEGTVRLPDYAGKNMFDFWKPLLTDVLINEVKADDGVLVHLATVEMERLFDWKKIRNEVKLIEPQFYTIVSGKKKIVSVQAKMCRGAMAKYIIENECTDIEQLCAFSYEGYVCKGGTLTDEGFITFMKD